MKYVALTSAIQNLKISYYISLTVPNRKALIKKKYLENSAFQQLNFFVNTETNNKVYKRSLDQVLKTQKTCLTLK